MFICTELKTSNQISSLFVYVLSLVADLSKILLKLFFPHSFEIPAINLYAVQINENEYQKRLNLQCVKLSIKNHKHKTLQGLFKKLFVMTFEGISFNVHGNNAHIIDWLCLLIIIYMNSNKNSLTLNDLFDIKNESTRGVQFNFVHFHFCNKMKTIQLTSFNFNRCLM